MRFGVREICDVVFKPLSAVDIGNQHFDAMQPVLYLDTAKTSTLEGAATTVYAQGGKGNPRLIGWDGEKTLTFTVEDALMSPVSFHVLSGAGIVKGMGDRNNVDGKQKIYVHQTYDLVAEASGDNLYVKLPYEIRNGATLIATKEAPIFATVLDNAGAQKVMLSAIAEDEIFFGDASAPGDQVKLGDKGVITDDPVQDLWFQLVYDEAGENPTSGYTDISQYVDVGDTVRIDCYAVYGDGAQELQIDAASFAGYYYIEASTLFRDEATGQDFPAEFVIPRGKIQSNFTFTMANSGDPSTFTFTIDAFPAYTKFNKTKKVMAALQIIDPEVAKHNYADHNVLGHNSYRDTKDSKEYYEDIYDNTSIFDQSENAGSGASEADQAAADAVSDMPVTTDTQKLAALQAYNKLTAAQKKLVSQEVRAAIGELTEEEEAQAAITAFIAEADELPETPSAVQISALLKKFASFTDAEEAQILEQLSAETKAKLGL